MRKRKFEVQKKILIYFAVFIIACCYIYNKMSNESLFYTKYVTKRDINATTFISTKYFEENGDIRLEGYFDNDLFRGIQVLAIRNASFLSRKFLVDLSNNRMTKDVVTTDEHQLKPNTSEQFNREISKNKSELKKRTKIKTQGGCPSFNTNTVIKETLSTDEKTKFPDWTLFENSRKVLNVNCKLLFQNSIHEFNRLKLMKKQPFLEIPSSTLIESTKNCEQYIKETGYITSSLTEEEENFPIAFSLVVFKGIQQVESLLRAIYRPQNVYCIHVDKNSEDDFRSAVHGIASCFENVFISSKSYRVVWGTIGVILPEIACMSDLWRHKKWKYFINLTGQEFPLRTNLELVKILKVYNGANDIEGTVKRMNKDRFTKAPKAPHSIHPLKGSVHIVANRGFVDFILHNKIGKDFLNWTRNVDIPDETFFTSLNHNPQLQIPGAYKGEPEMDCVKKPFIARFKNWGNHIYNWPCRGHRVRNVCVFGVGDLPLLATRQEMFANKFYLHGETYAYRCMEELLFNRTRDEYFGTLRFDTQYYESLEFIKNTV